MYEIIMDLPFNGFHVKGVLSLPVRAKSIVIFSHGFGSAFLAPHEQTIAHLLQKEGIGTLVFDLLDEKDDLPNRYKDIDLLSRGLITATNWLHGHSDYRSLDLAFLGSGTGAAIAVKAADKLGFAIKAAILLSGRLDLVREELSQSPTPLLMITGEYDFQCVKLNKEALNKIKAPKQLAIIPGASHLFEEPGKTNEAARIAISWLAKYLAVEKKAEPVQQK